jgi:hypothetical protein
MTVTVAPIPAPIRAAWLPATPPPRIGEYRVGITFNPGGNEMVDKIKRAAADLIDLVETIEVGSVSGPEGARLKALAMTDIEDAAMWAVKAATKPPRV